MNSLAVSEAPARTSSLSFGFRIPGWLFFPLLLGSVLALSSAINYIHPVRSEAVWEARLSDQGCPEFSLRMKLLPAGEQTWERYNAYRNICAER